MRTYLLLSLSVFSFFTKGQEIRGALMDKMDARFSQHLDSIQIVINYSTPDFNSKVAIFYMDKSGQWHAEMNIWKTHHRIGKFTAYTLTPKTDWKSDMAHFYASGIDSLKDQSKY